MEDVRVVVLIVIEVFVMLQMGGVWMGVYKDFMVRYVSIFVQIIVYMISVVLIWGFVILGVYMVFMVICVI